MERLDLYAFAAIVIVVAVLAIIAVADYFTIASLNDQLSFYKAQQREFSRVVTAQYLGDMDAARRAWIAANQGEYVSLQNQGIAIEADSIATQGYTVVLDPQDPSMATIGPASSDVAPGEVVVYLGQYHGDNMTRVPGWSVSYTVNATTHAVTGLTSLLVQNVAYQYYTNAIAPVIDQKLGVANGTVTGFKGQSIDCSYLPESGDWQDVSEYRYSMKNTGLKPYLLIKTYVNATDEAVVGVDFSTPYYASVTGVDY